MKAVIVAPEFDFVTKQSSAWCEEVADLFEEKVYLTGRAISRVEVEEALRKNPKAIFIFYDHGSEDVLWGSRTEKVVDLFNTDLLAGREVYTLACLSAKLLGRKAHRRKCRAYWGYEEEFTFTLDALEEFRASANEGIKLRLKGLGWKKCLKKTKQLMTELANKLMAQGRILASICMESNSNCLRCWDTETPPLSLKDLFVRFLGRLPRLAGLGIILFIAGWGITLHAVANELYLKGGYTEILKPQGEWIGLALSLLGFILLTRKLFEWLTG